MCGRARCTLNPQDVSRACGMDGSIPTLQYERYTPSYNVSPGSYLPVVRKEHGPDQMPVLHCMKWGLVPSFTKKSERLDHFKMFNARSESICEKASFRRLIPNNRCLVAVEGFYEWKKDGQKKQPYYIHFRDQRPLVFGALYDSWQSPEGETLYTFTILTTSCSSALHWLHDRMPVIFGNKEASDAWLNSSPPSKIDAFLRPYEESDLVWYPVTSAMGKPSFNGLECIKEIQLNPGKNSISKFFSKNRADIKHGCKGSPQESVYSDLVENPKEASHSPGNKGLDSEGPKFEASSQLLTEGAGKFGTKRDFQHLTPDPEFKYTDDEKPTKTSSLNSKSKHHPLDSPPKKKANLTAGDKQLTLFSYFGKS